MEGVLAGISSEDSIVMLGDLNAYVGNDSENWKGILGKNLPYWNLSGDQLLNFCANHMSNSTSSWCQMDNIQSRGLQDAV